MNLIRELFIGRIVIGLEAKENASDFPSWANADRKAQFSLLQVISLYFVLLTLTFLHCSSNAKSDIRLRYPHLYKD